MPTLLEKPSASPALLPTQVLHSRHRWERWRGVLVTLLAGLAATLIMLLVLHPMVHLKVLAVAWAAGFLLTLIAAAIAWKFSSASLADTAQGIDRNLAAKNRLEALAALHESASPLAKAQREETADYLRQEPRARPVRALPWLIGGIIALALAHFILAGIWGIPALLRPSAPKPPPPPKEIPHASIVWKSPEAESKANPVEEVPTVALAQSTSGLRDLTLEISVNGTPKKSQPLPVQPFDQPGKNTIKVSLYMDELAVEPFDVVSYYLRGQRIADQKLSETTSAIQFIQVRPFRDDVKLVHGLPFPGAGKLDDLILELKLAQLKAMKENFILTHTDLPVTDPTRMKENDRVGKNQGDLSAKTEEVVQALIQAGVPTNIVDLLQQAEPLMTDASKKILATKNAEGLAPQGKALDLIIQIEKFVEKEIDLQPPPGQATPPPPDPFKDKQQHELKQRIKGAAGQLELLAKKQTELAKDVNQSPASQGSSSSGSEPSKGTPDSQNKPDGQQAQSPPAPGAASPGSQDGSPQPSPGTSPANGKPDSQKGQGSPGQQASPAPAPGAEPPQGQGGSQPTPGTSPDDSSKPGDTPQSVDPFAPGADKGTLAERQAQVLQGIEALQATNDVLPPSVAQALQDAQKQATESVHQLDQGNNAGAREPAAAAAQDLQRAVTEMNAAGEKATQLAMQQAQQQLNDAAKQLKGLAKDGAPGSQQPGLSDVAAKVLDVQKQAGDAADQQQETGSSKGAQHLANLANQISGQHLPKDIATMAQKGLDPNQAGIMAQKLEALASQAGQGMTGDKPSAQEIARLIASLEASRANLARLAQQAGAPGAENPGAQPPASDQHGPGQDPQTGADQGQHPGQGQGQGQGPQPGQDPGQGAGQGQQPGKDPGQGQGQGDQPGKGQGQGQGQGQDTQTGGTQPGGTAPGGSAPGGTAPGGVGPDGMSDTKNKAYQDAMADVQDEVQQATAMVPPADAKEVQDKLDDAQAQHGKDDKVREINVVRAYQAIAPPLDKLIQDLTTLMTQAQRQDLIKQPDLDEAPPQYRPAVSDYFENMSRDYHPDNADADAKKP